MTPTHLHLQCLHTLQHLSAVRTFQQTFFEYFNIFFVDLVREGDTKFRSRDNVIFHIHQKYLELAAEGFPSSFSNGLTATAKFDEIIPLTEMSTTLDLLFQFVYPKDQPDLLHLEFQAVMDLAKAAEKYVVYNAINVCQFRIKSVFAPSSFDDASLNLFVETFFLITSRKYSTLLRHTIMLLCLRLSLL